MNPNYTNISYEQLNAFREQLEELQRTGENYPDVRTQLKAVTGEIGERKYALVGTLSGGIVREYGRWGTEKKCQDQATAMGLPVDQDFEMSGQPFKTAVRQLF